MAGPTVSHDVLDTILAHLLPLLGLCQNLDQGISDLLATVGVHQQAMMQRGHDVHWPPVLGGHCRHSVRSSLNKQEHH